jgi:archaellum biogenesis ATPase FlaH
MVLLEHKASTGSEGLDDILGGGFAHGYLFLLEGETGFGQDYDCIAVSFGGCPRWRENALRDAFGANIAFRA